MTKRRAYRVLHDLARHLRTRDLFAFALLYPDADAVIAEAWAACEHPMLMADLIARIHGADKAYQCGEVPWDAIVQAARRYSGAEVANSIRASVRLPSFADMLARLATVASA